MDPGTTLEQLKKSGTTRAERPEQFSTEPAYFIINL